MLKIPGGRFLFKDDLFLFCLTHTGNNEDDSFGIFFASEFQHFGLGEEIPMDLQVEALGRVRWRSLIIIENDDV